MPKCENCHTCNDQWEDIVSELEKKITYLIKLKGNFTFNVSEIELYSKEIQKLKDNLKMIEEGMENKRVKGDDVDDLRRKVFYLFCIDFVTFFLFSSMLICLRWTENAFVKFVAIASYPMKIYETFKTENKDTGNPLNIYY